MKKMFAAALVAGVLVTGPAQAGWGAWAQCMAEHQAEGTVWPLRAIAPGWFYVLIFNEAFACG